MTIQEINQLKFVAYRFSKLKSSSGFLYKRTNGNSEIKVNPDFIQIYISERFGAGGTFIILNKWEKNNAHHFHLVQYNQNFSIESQIEAAQDALIDIWCVFLSYDGSKGGLIKVNDSSGFYLKA